MSWPYADLSHEAKEHGGPEQYTQDIHDGGVAEGRVQGGVVVGVAALAIGALIEAGRRIYNSKIAKAATAKEILEAELKSSALTETTSEDALPASEENDSAVDSAQEESRDPGNLQDENPENGNDEEE